MKIFKTIIIGIIFSVLPLSFMAQNNDRIILSLSRDTIVIGEQIELNIKIPFTENTKFEFPQFKDTLTTSRIECLSEKNIREIEENGEKIINKTYLITSFDTGITVIPPINVKLISNGDTNAINSNSVELFVKPYVLIDTIPVDTIFAGRAGYIVRGKNGFKREIEQYIPDSIKESVSSDSLQKIQESFKEQLLNIFSSEVTKNTGLYNQNEILRIAESSEQKMYVVDKEGILEEYIVPGSVDTVFVNEYDKVVQNQALFTVYKIKDINDELYNTPFNFKEFLYYLKKYFKKYWWILLLAIFVAALIIYLIKNKGNKKNTKIFKIKPQAPAHVIALEKLEQIRKEKLWAKGMVKEYHIQITETIREYIENRFGINALEMTTSETIEALENLNEISKDSLSKLRQLLELGDAVKFAKYKALQNENDLSIENAFGFVNDTKEKEEPNSDAKKLEAEIEVEIKDTENSRDIKENE